MKKSVAELYVRSNRLRVGDRFTETVKTEMREVQITSTHITEISYAGQFVPVYMIEGFDIVTSREFKTVASPRRLWEITREVGS